MNSDTKIKLVRIFNQLAEIEINKGRFFPSRAFKNSANNIEKSNNYEIIGDRVKLFINDDIVVLGCSSSEVFIDVINTGKSTRYESECHYLSDSSNLTEISGIGAVKSEILIKSGISSIEDLINLKPVVNEYIPGTDINFTHNMDVGLKFWIKTRNQRIPRDKAIEYLTDFKQYIINNGVENFEMYPVGSFRRQKDTVGDIDIILTSTKEHEISLNAFDVISKWFDEVYVHGETKIAGVKGNTQVDVRLIDRKYLGAHILHGTGSQEFNIKIRAHAKSLGLRLNEYGIVKDNELITFDKEIDVFKYLNYKYVKPQDR